MGRCCHCNKDLTKLSYHRESILCWNCYEEWVNTKTIDNKKEDIINKPKYCSKCKGDDSIYYNKYVGKDLCKKCEGESNVIEDVINKPNHYHEGGIDPIGLGKKIFTDEEMMGFYKMNILKYRMRAGKKEGNSEEQDLMKADFYEKKLKELYNERIYSRRK